MRIKPHFAIIAVAALVSGCVTTQKMPLAPNMVRLDTHASGVLFAGNAANATMQKAAVALQL